MIEAEENFAKKAEAKANAVIERCAKPVGLFASGTKYGYTSVWARDSMLALIGASFRDNKKKFKPVFSKTLATLSKHQTKLGQIPNCVDLFEKRREKQVTFATIDSSLWFILGEYFFKENYKDSALFNMHKKSISNAMLWVQYQDAGNDCLPEQQPTSDWQDCFPHKYGHTINTIALYYASLLCLKRKKEAARVKKQADKLLYSQKLGYYLPWAWKNHDGEREQEEWFDSLGNLLAINFGLAGEEKSKKILSFIQKKGIDKPFPVKAIFPPIKKGDKEWKAYFSKCLAGKPNNYINGGIWPCIGGFYVSALVKIEGVEKARESLYWLTQANRIGIRTEWEFNEWIHPTKMKAMGSAYQAWSAGAFLLALEAIERKGKIFEF